MPTAPQLSISEQGSIREVRLDGPVFYHGGWHDGVQFQTVYRPETIRAIYEIKTHYTYDEVLRVEDPGYLYDQFITFLLRVTSLQGKTILDFGSGAGSSSILLAREGAQRIHSIELLDGLRGAARLRVRDEGLDRVISVDDAEAMTRLPYQSETFDIVTMNAVVEHVRPEQRAPILQHLSQLLRPGGYLIITETPNRLYPFDSHTTRLPLVSWMPLSLACATARTLRRSEFGRKSNDDLVYDGIVGSTWWGLRRDLPRDMEPAALNPRLEHEAYFSRLRGRKQGRSRMIVEALAAAFKPLTMEARWAKQAPLNAFLPYLNIAFRKSEPPRGGSRG